MAKEMEDTEVIDFNKDDVDEDDVGGESEEEYKERVTSLDLERLMRKLNKDIAIVYKLKEENRSLKRKIEGLTHNNDKFVDLVAELNAKANRVRVKRENDLVYSYQEGSMVKNEEAGKHWIRLHKKKLTLNEINNQLSLILSKLEKEKKL